MLKMSIDYEVEQKKLEDFKPEEGSLFWKPTAGQHKVKALSELEEAEPYEDKPQFKLKVLVNEEEKVWTFAKGKSPASTYGQIVALATRKDFILKDVEFTVVVVNDGNKNSYTIVG
ncbi:hypothetical protein LCGC14_1963750 [marine sediment metagenome]|uniref:Uncharacterized protein n=1 Tax=marine sediment metagenome TaxID=412755 RepID=A0A0F9G265_9ZZZZ